MATALFFTIFANPECRRVAAVHGLVTTSLGVSAFKMMLSRDAGIIVLTFSGVKGLEVFINNGYGF